MDRRLLGRSAAAATFAAALGGCYMVPMAPDGRPAWALDADGGVQPRAPDAATRLPGTPPGTRASTARPLVLAAHLYPANEVAARIGTLAGTVVNRMDGRGEFRLVVDGETLVGEATRLPGDDARGVASGFGSRGTSMSCRYGLSSPTVGMGECRLSNGGAWRLHLGPVP